MKKLTTTLLFTLSLGTALAGDESSVQSEADRQAEASKAYQKAIDACHWQYRLRMQEIEARIREHNPDFCGTAQYTLLPEDPKAFEKSLYQELDKLPMDDDLRVIRYLSFPEMARQTGQTDWAKQVDIEKLSIPVLAVYSLHCIEMRDACDQQAPLKALQEQEPDWAVTWLLTLQAMKEEDPQDILALLADSEKIESFWIQPELLEKLLLQADQMINTDIVQEQIHLQELEDWQAFIRHGLTHSISMASNDGILIHLWVTCAQEMEKGNAAAADSCMRFARKLLVQPQGYDAWGIDKTHQFAIDWLKKQGQIQEAAALKEQWELFKKQSSNAERSVNKLFNVACSSPQARQILNDWQEQEFFHGRLAANQWLAQQTLQEFPVLDRKTLMKAYSQDLQETADAEVSQCIDEANERWYPQQDNNEPHDPAR